MSKRNFVTTQRSMAETFDRCVRRAEESGQKNRLNRKKTTYNKESKRNAKKSKKW